MTSTDSTINDNAEGHYAVTEADLLRATERNRLRALVEADMETAYQLHADDFQLINPAGGALSKEQYLGGIASGDNPVSLVGAGVDCRACAGPDSNPALPGTTRNQCQ